jgi:hypothetical protein
VEKMPPYSELTSKMLSEFCFLDNAKALEYIINPITAQMILSNASRVEVEPSRCATTQILRENQQTLRNTAQHFFRCLTTSLPLVSPYAEPPLPSPPLSGSHWHHQRVDHGVFTRVVCSCACVRARVLINVADEAGT